MACHPDLRYQEKILKIFLKNGRNIFRKKKKVSPSWPLWVIIIVGVVVGRSLEVWQEKEATIGGLFILALCLSLSLSRIRSQMNKEEEEGEAACKKMVGLCLGVISVTRLGYF